MSNHSNNEGFKQEDQNEEQNSPKANGKVKDELEFEENKEQSQYNQKYSIEAQSSTCLYDTDDSCFDNVELKSDGNIMKESDNQPYVGPTASKLEREILLRGETSDNKRKKILQLPVEVMPTSANYCEKEIMGDDIAKSKAHILCECDNPGVAGAAVPIVTSFTVSNATSNDIDSYRSESKIPLLRRDAGSENKSRPSLIPKYSNSVRNEKANVLSRNELINSLSPCSNREDNPETKSTRNISFKPQPQVNKKDENTKNCHLRFNEEKRYESLTEEFSTNASRFAEEASLLPEIENVSSQVTAVNNLYRRVLDLKKLINELQSLQDRRSSKTTISEEMQNIDSEEERNEPNNKFKNKESNKIYIKFLPSKCSVKKRKSCNSEVQTDFNLKNSNEEEATLNDIDSMDGIFIPSYDDPPKMEEEEDEDGLDITITFPELQKTLEENKESHLSVCFSNISAEALGRLKRCPKEFTLRMDFVQGKMFFQSGKFPVNNFSIGPDLKITECSIDSKQSDIISIKPSTECLYTSQIIPVEGTTRRESIRILKSTDSELFNVVSLPYINKRNSVSTKSCITFKNNIRRVSSESFIPDRIHYKSMPQIPSLTKILEEPTLETINSGTRTTMANGEKKPRNRNLQRKRTNLSLENILHDTP